MKVCRMSGLLCLLLILAVSNLFVSPQALALSCAEVAPAEKAYEDAEVVFKGTVKTNKRDTFIFQVHTVYKGETGARTVVKDMTEDWLQETLKEGGSYLVYGYDERFHVEVSPCGRTNDWMVLKSDVDKFPNRELIHYDNDDYLKENRNRRFLFSGILLSAALLIGGIWVYRKRRQMKQ